MKSSRIGPESVTSLPNQPGGRPLLLPTDIDIRVKRHLYAIRDAGGIVNRRVAIGTGIGCIRAMRPALLQELGKPWADSLLRRIDFVKRKATKAARKLPGNFTELKSDFHRRVTSIVEEHSIPAQLVINMDETGLPTVPVSQWTLEEAGSRQVPVFGLEDKRQITALLACSATGTLLSFLLTLTSPAMMK
eukprot:scpid79137/ scgid18001/ 